MKTLILFMITAANLVIANVDACLEKRTETEKNFSIEELSQEEGENGFEVLVCSELDFKDYSFWKMPTLFSNHFGKHTPFFYKEMVGADLAEELIDQYESENPNDPILPASLGIVDLGINFDTIPKEAFVGQALECYQRRDCDILMSRNPDEIMHGTAAAQIAAGDPAFKLSSKAKVSYIGRLIQSARQDGAFFSVDNAAARASIHQFLDEILALENPPSVLNFSFGGKLMNERAIKEKIKKILDHGIIIVTANSNHDKAPKEDFQSFDGVITVASIEANGLPVGFSQDSRDIDISTFGGSGMHVLIDGHYEKLNNVTVSNLRGNSFAAPQVSSAATTLASILPGITGPELLKMIKETAIKSRVAGKKQGGNGILNFYKMVHLALKLRKDWPSNRGQLKTTSFYNLSHEAQKFKLMADQRAALSDCGSDGAFFRGYRKAFFLNSSDKKVKDTLASTYDLYDMKAQASFIRGDAKRDIVKSLPLKRGAFESLIDSKGPAANQVLRETYKSNDFERQIELTGAYLTMDQRKKALKTLKKAWSNPKMSDEERVELFDRFHGYSDLATLSYSPQVSEDMFRDMYYSSSPERIIEALGHVEGMDSLNDVLTSFTVHPDASLVRWKQGDSSFGSFRILRMFSKEKEDRFIELLQSPNEEVQKKAWNVVFGGELNFRDLPKIIGLALEHKDQAIYHTGVSLLTSQTHWFEKEDDDKRFELIEKVLSGENDQLKQEVVLSLLGKTRGLVKWLKKPLIAKEKIFELIKRYPEVIMPNNSYNDHLLHQVEHDFVKTRGMDEYFELAAIVYELGHDQSRGVSLKAISDLYVQNDEEKRKEYNIRASSFVRKKFEEILKLEPVDEIALQATWIYAPRKDRVEYILRAAIATKSLESKGKLIKELIYLDPLNKEKYLQMAKNNDSDELEVELYKALYTDMVYKREEYPDIHSLLMNGLNSENPLLQSWAKMHVGFLLKQKENAQDERVFDGEYYFLNTEKPNPNLDLKALTLKAISLENDYFKNQNPDSLLLYMAGDYMPKSELKSELSRMKTHFAPYKEIIAEINDLSEVTRLMKYYRLMADYDQVIGDSLWNQRNKGDEHFRAELAYALRSVFPKENALRKLKELSQDRSAKVRMACADELLKYQDNEAKIALLDLALADSDPVVQNYVQKLMTRSMIEHLDQVENDLISELYRDIEKRYQFEHPEWGIKGKKQYNKR